MKCNRLRKYFIPYSEGSLPQNLERLVAEHVAKCPACALEMEEVKSTVNLLRQTSYPAMEPSVNLRSRVMARVAREPEPKRHFLGTFQRYAGAAAAVFLLAILSVVLVSVISKTPGGVRQASNPAAEIENLKTLGYSEGGHAPVRSAGKAKTETPKTVKGSGSITQAQKRDRSTAGGAVDAVNVTGNVVRTHAKAAANQFSVGKSIMFQRTLDAPSNAEGAVARPEGVTGEETPTEPKTLAMKSKYRDERVYGDADVTAPKADATGLGGKGGGVSDYYYDTAGDGAGVRGPAGLAGGSEQARVKFKSFEAPSPAAAAPMTKYSLHDATESQSSMLKLLKEYRDAGRSEDEYAMAERLTRADSKNASYWFMLGQAAEKAKMPNAALSAYKQAIINHLEGSDLDIAKKRVEELTKSKQ